MSQWYTRSRSWRRSGDRGRAGSDRSYLTAATLICVGFLTLAAGCGEKSRARLEVVASGLELPWSLAFPPDGRILIVERPGRIRVVVDGELQPEPWATLAVTTEGTSGLLGMDLGPDYEETGHVYVIGSFLIEGCQGERIGDCLQHRVIRLTDQGLTGTDPTIIVDGLPARHTHSGAALRFGPDGMMYVTIGDNGKPPFGQDMSSLIAKILRYTPDGEIPEDNPSPPSPIYTLGNRNTQSLSWHPETRDLFAPDQGPSNRRNEYGRKAGDELNVILAGENYGWPIMSGWMVWEDDREVKRDDPRFVSPIMDWTGRDGIAPSGSAFYTGDYGPWRNNLFVAFLRSQHLRRIVLERAPGSRTGWRVADEEVLFKEEIGRVRTVAMGLDGYLYISTDNRHKQIAGTIRGVAGLPGAVRPAPDDDRVFRVVPEP